MKISKKKYKENNIIQIFFIAISAIMAIRKTRCFFYLFYYILSREGSTECRLILVQFSLQKAPEKIMLILNMTKNPLVNSFVAIIYIVLIASVMFYGTKNVGPSDSIIAPIAVVSLFTLSAAVMGYLFCYQPAQLYFDDKKKQAVTLFLQTVGIFGGITAVVLMLLFTGVFS